MRRRDLKEGMRVVLCTRPWARRVLRYAKTWKVPEEEKWICNHGALMACFEAKVINPQEYWDRDAKYKLVQVEKSAKVLVKYKTYNHVPIGRKKTRREEVWEKDVVKSVDLLMPMEDFLPIQKVILSDFRKLILMTMGKAGGDTSKIPSELPPFFT